MTPNRYTLFPAAALFLLVFACISCKKNHTGDTSSGFTVSINGTAFTTAASNALYTPGTNQLDITGLAIQNQDSEYITIIIPDSSINTPIDTKKIANIIFYDAGQHFIYDSWADNSHGTLTVTSLNLNSRTVSGFFSGVLYAYSGSDSVTFTVGKFSVPFVVQ